MLSPNLFALIAIPLHTMVALSAIPLLTEPEEMEYSDAGTAKRFSSIKGGHSSGVQQEPEEVEYSEHPAAAQLEHPAAAQIGPLRPYQELEGVRGACDDRPRFLVVAGVVRLRRQMTDDSTKTTCSSKNTWGTHPTSAYFF